MRDMERSIAVMSASPKDRDSCAKRDGNGGEVRAEKGTDSDDIELDEDSDREGQDYDGRLDKGEDAQKDGDGRKGSGTANGPGVVSKYPMFFPVGARVILKKLGAYKKAPKDLLGDRSDLIGKTVRRRCLDRG